MDNSRSNSPSDDLAEAVGFGLSLAGKLFLYCFALPFCLAGILLAALGEDWQSKVAGILFIAGSISILPSTIDSMIRFQMEEGLKPFAMRWHFGAYLSLLIIAFYLLGM